jgi:hypothetical protein
MLEDGLPHLLSICPDVRDPVLSSRKAGRDVPICQDEIKIQFVDGKPMLIDTLSDGAASNRRQIVIIKL